MSVSKSEPQEVTDRKREFITVYAEIGHVGLAGNRARVPLATHSTWLARDPDYRKQFEQTRAGLCSKYQTTKPGNKIRYGLERKPRQSRFLRFLAKLGSITLAAAKAGIDRKAERYWREIDLEYRSQFEEISARLRQDPPPTWQQRRRQPKQKLFLSTYTKLGNITRAAAKAAIHIGTHYFWLRSDPKYRELFKKATARIHSNPPQTWQQQERRPKQRVFLRHYAKTGRIDLAAEKAGITRSAHCYWLIVDPDYRKQFEETRDRIHLDPPPTLVPIIRRAGPDRTPKGFGSVRQIREGVFDISWSRGPKGRRERARERLRNVSEKEARQRVLEHLKQDTPLVGALRFGHMPSIEALISIRREETQKENVRPEGFTRRGLPRRKRPYYSGRVITLKNSRALCWVDSDGQRHWENVGNISDSEANTLLEQRTLPGRIIREQGEQARKAAMKLLHTSTIMRAQQSGRQGRRSEWPSAQWDVIIAQAESVRHQPKEIRAKNFADALDFHHIPPSNRIREDFASWGRAYRNNDTLRGTIQKFLKRILKGYRPSVLASGQK